MNTISDKDRAEAQALAEAFLGEAMEGMSDSVVPWWLAVRDHVLAAHECPTVPVWRPTTFEEIRAGWEVRSRRRNGSESAWGVAHHQDDDGDWHTEDNWLLTDWVDPTTYEVDPTSIPDPDAELIEALREASWLIESSGQTGQWIGTFTEARDLLNKLRELGWTVIRESEATA